MDSPSTLKSQSLHNFQLRDLKWAMKHTNNHRLCKLSESSHKTTQRGDTDTDSESGNNGKGSPVCEALPKNGASLSSSPDHRTGKSEKKVVNGSPILLDDSSDSQATPVDGKPKIYLRFRLKNKKPADDVADVGHQNFNAEDFEEEPICLNENGGGLKIGGPADKNKTRKPESSRSRIVTEPTAAKKKENKPKFSLSLTREEIEEDIFAMTGSKPSRKPQRRPKNVQKELDVRKDRITPNSYKLPESPKKGLRI
ncbi:hypothetical protein DITRI_Ditri13aG0015400 [Diplodiscus trichospermus]